jgi:CO/xanthine dehydrogenase FAD-binding subunit
MKPPPFDYHRAESLDEALDELATREDAKALAGGQSLVPMMNFRIARPAHLIDIHRVAELDHVRAGADGELRIGAVTRQATVERSPLVAGGWPLLTGAIECVAHPQIRARGTVGGSLAHADPAAELPVAVAALDGRLRVRSRRGERVLSWRDFFDAPLQTTLAEDELLVELIVPARRPRSGSAFCEYATRHGDFAIAGAAAVATVGTGGELSLTLSLLGAGPAPVTWSSSPADGLDGELTPGEARACAREALGGAELADSAEIPATYRRRLLEGLAAEAARRAAARARAAAAATEEAA